MITFICVFLGSHRAKPACLTGVDAQELRGDGKAELFFHEAGLRQGFVAAATRLGFFWSSGRTKMNTRRGHSIKQFYDIRRNRQKPPRPRRGASIWPLLSQPAQRLGCSSYNYWTHLYEFPWIIARRRAALVTVIAGTRLTRRGGQCPAQRVLRMTFPGLP